MLGVILDTVSDDRATVPAWVIPRALSVRDAHRIAYRRANQIGDVRAAAVSAAINWATGGQPAPLTQRREVTRDLAWVEWLLAGSVETGTPMVWGEVPPVPPVTRDHRWAAGVSAALAWLLGATDRPPVPIPRRRPDGSIPTADELYGEMVAARPHASWPPEQRAEARRRATEVAVANRHLAELADTG